MPTVIAPDVPEKIRIDSDQFLSSSEPATVLDLEENIINGYVVAELGPFKTPGRGQFSSDSLRQIVDLGNASQAGLKSRFTHPTLSDDGLGTFLGRARNFRLNQTNQPTRVLADLHLDKTAFTSPRGNLGKYVMDLAETDPDAFGTSLVLETKQLNPETLDEITGAYDADKLGPPVWMPTALHASDVVDTGDATNSFLSHEYLADATVRRASEMLDRIWPHIERDEMKQRMLGFVDKYLAYRFKEEPMPDSTTTEPELAQDNIIGEASDSSGQPTTSTPEPEEAALSATDRVQEILGLCQLCGGDLKTASDLIADTSLTVGDVRKHLTDMVWKQRKLSAPPDDVEDDPLAKQKLEWKKDYQRLKAAYLSAGITEEQFFAWKEKQE